MSELLRVRPDDPEYLAMAAAEAAFWGDHKGCADFADSANTRESQQHLNRRFTGDENTRWYETIPRYGDFKRGLVLGAAGIIREAYILESNPSLHLTFMDISPGAVEKRKDELAARFPGRVATAVGDFNFAELSENSFDLVVSSSVLHHVINLEYLAAQINRALTPDGYFFLEDYVGETLRKFSPEKKLAYELAYSREMTRQGRTPPSYMVWSNEEAVASPFCGIRSADILEALRGHLHEEKRATTGALWFAVMFARDPRPGAFKINGLRWRTTPVIRRVVRYFDRRRNRSADGLLPREYVERLLEVGDRLSDAGVILPSNAFAIYRRRTG